MQVMTSLKLLAVLLLCGLVLGQDEALVNTIGRTETLIQPEVASTPEESSSLAVNQTDDQAYAQSISSRQLDIPNEYSPTPQSTSSSPPLSPLQSPVSISPFPTTPNLLPYFDLQPANTRRSQPEPSPVFPPPPIPIMRVASTTDFAAWAGIDSDDLDDGDVYAIIRTSTADISDDDDLDEDDLTFTRSFLQVPNPS